MKGDTVDINLPYMDYGYRITFFGDEIESIETLELSTGKRIMKVDNAAIFPANLYLAPKDKLQQILYEIQDEAQSKQNILKAPVNILKRKEFQNG